MLFCSPTRRRTTPRPTYSQPMTSAVARLTSARLIRIIRPWRISASDSRTAAVADASLRVRRLATSFSNSWASARFSTTTLAPVLAATSSFCFSSKTLPASLPVLTSSSTSFDVSASLKAAAALPRRPAVAVKRSLTGGSNSTDGRSAASTRIPRMRLDSARRLQDGLQRRQFVVSQRGQRLLNDLEVLLVRRRLTGRASG